MQRTISQNRRLHTLLGRLHIDADTKACMVQDFTAYRTAHSSEMTVEECNRMISALNQAFFAQDKVLDKKRKRVISHLKEAGYILPNGKADMYAIYGWVLRQKHRKSLNRLNGKELSDLIYAAEKVKEHFLSKI